MATQRIREFLDGNHARYVLISHSPAYTAQEVAQSVHVPGKYMAKTVVVVVDGRLALAVVSATKEVDLGRLGAAAGDVPDVRLANPHEFVDRFTGCQLGTVPPFGILFGTDTYVDRDLARLDAIVFNAGTHTEVISMTFADYRRLAHPRLATIAREPDRSRAMSIQI